MHDTSRDAAQVARDAGGRTDPVDRMRRALAHSETRRALALARLCARHPELSTVALVELLLGERLLPDDLAAGGPCRV